MNGIVFTRHEPRILAVLFALFVSLCSELLYFHSHQCVHCKFTKYRSV